VIQEVNQVIKNNAVPAVAYNSRSASKTAL
jgi:hypothetical protein